MQGKLGFNKLNLEGLRQQDEKENEKKGFSLDLGKANN